MAGMIAFSKIFSYTGIGGGTKKEKIKKKKTKKIKKHQKNVYKSKSTLYNKIVVRLIKKWKVKQC